MGVWEQPDMACMSTALWYMILNKDTLLRAEKDGVAFLMIST